MNTKKFWAGMIIAAVLSVIMITAGFLMGGGVSDLRSTFTAASEDSSMTDIADAKLKDVRKVNINTKYCKVKVQYGDGSRIEVSSDGEACDKYVKDGTLYVGYSEGTKYQAKLPAGSIKLDSEKIAGQGVVSVTLPDSLDLDEFNINGKSTKLDASQIKAKSFNADINRGNISIDDLEADSVQIQTKHCPVRAGRINTKENCSVFAKGGSVSLGEDSDTVNNISGLAVQTGYGDINIHSKVNGMGQIKSSHGHINLTLNGSEQSYALTGSFTNSTSASGTYGSIDISGKAARIKVDYDSKVK